MEEETAWEPEVRCFPQSQICSGLACSIAPKAKHVISDSVFQFLFTFKLDQKLMITPSAVCPYFAIYASTGERGLPGSNPGLRAVWFTRLISHCLHQENNLVSSVQFTGLHWKNRPVVCSKCACLHPCVFVRQGCFAMNCFLEFSNGISKRSLLLFQIACKRQCVHVFRERSLHRSEPLSEKEEIFKEHNVFEWI